jgi:sulfatase maturation enzyme AslB (radical SAM superfamily)
MTLDIAKSAVDLIVNNYNIKKEKGWLGKDERKGVTFFGGEPMLMYDQIIVPLIKYIENTYNINEFHFDITTNGTLLNEERLVFMSKYSIYPLLSIDGDRET